MTTAILTRHFATVSDGVLMALQSLDVVDEYPVLIARKVEEAERPQDVGFYLYAEAEKDDDRSNGLYELDRDLRLELTGDEEIDGAIVLAQGVLLARFDEKPMASDTLNDLCRLRENAWALPGRDGQLGHRLEERALIAGDMEQIEAFFAESEE